jgi:predicted Zn finger-like uncharacterized protein
MRLADGIRKHGFRKWYERELLRSHGHMALLVMCTLGILGSLEAASSARTASDRVTDLLTMLVCAGAGIWSLRRYLYLLSHAEAVANQATCPACQTYARLNLLQASDDGGTVLVCCRKCEHRWQIES